MIQRSDVSIIMPHFGASPEMENAFNESYASLRESEPEIRIVVAKNGPACVHQRDIRVLSQGQCKAVNAAVAITDTPWILVTNDDMIYPPGWFEKLTVWNPEYEGHFKIDIEHFVDPICISPKLIEPRPGAPTFEVFFAGDAGGDFDKQRFFDFVKSKENTYESTRTGFNLPFLIRRDLWDLIGGYDIKYDPWGSNGDSDLEYKIRLAGIQPYQNPNCLVYHFSQTSGTFHPDNRAYLARNYAYFKEKWGFDRTDTGIWEANFYMPGASEGRIFFPPWEDKYTR